MKRLCETSTTFTLLLCGLLQPKAAFFFFPPLFLSFFEVGAVGVTHFLQQSPTWCSFSVLGFAHGARGCAGALGRHKIPGLDELGSVLEPPRAFLAGIPARLWLCSDIQGDRESSGGLCPSRAILVLPVRIIPVFVCLEQPLA